MPAAKVDARTQAVLKGVGIVRTAFDSVSVPHRSKALDPPQLRRAKGRFNDLKYADVKYFEDGTALVYGEAERIVERSECKDAVILAVPSWQGSREGNARLVTASPELHGIVAYDNTFAVIGGQYLPGSIEFNIGHDMGRRVSTSARSAGSNLIGSSREDYAYVNNGAEDKFAKVLARAIDEAVRARK